MMNTSDVAGRFSPTMAFLVAFVLLAGPRLEGFDVHAISVLTISSLYLIFSIMTGKMDRPPVVFFLSLFPSLLYATFVGGFFYEGTMELPYLLLRAYVYAFAAAFLLNLYGLVYTNDWAIRLLRHVIFLWGVLAVSGIMFVFIAAYRSWVGEHFFIDGQYHWVEYGYRAYDLVSGGGFNGAFGYVAAILMISLLWRRLRFSGIHTIIFAGLISFAGVLMARSFIVLLIVGFAILIMLMTLRTVLTKKTVVGKGLVVPPVVVGVFSIALYASLDLLPDAVRAWALEFIGSEGQGFVMPSSAESILERMYFIPDSALGIFFGEGYLGRWVSGPFLNSDIGFVRFLFNSGILGLALILTPLLFISATAAYEYLRYGDRMALLVACLGVLIVVANGKELFFLPRNTGLLILVIVFVYMEERHRRVARVRGNRKAFFGDGYKGCCAKRRLLDC